MRIYIVFLFTGLIFSTSCSSYNRITNTEDVMQIIPGKGLGGLVLGETVRKDAEKLFGKGEKKKQIIHFRNDYSNKWVYVYKSGVELTYSQMNSSEKDTLTRIRFFGLFEYKTIDGIMRGSTRQQVQNSFGEPVKVIFEKLINGFNHSIKYENVTFIFDREGGNLNSKMDDPIKEILLW